MMLKLEWSFGLQNEKQWIATNCAIVNGSFIEELRKNERKAWIAQFGPKNEKLWIDP